MKSIELESFSLSKVSEEIFSSQRIFGQIERLLASWFDAGLQRSSKVELANLPNPDSLALRYLLWASLVYKRGFTKPLWPNESNLTLHTSKPATESALSTASLVPKFSRMKSDDLSAYIQDQLSERETLLIIDSGFIDFWPNWKSLFTVSSRCILYEPKESTKNLLTLRNWWQSTKETKKPIEQVWSVGGGITSDMAAFLAALFEIEHKSSPTTLLSASDASIGGKTGVNFGTYGKNQLGLFYPTTTWIVVPEHFSTLSHVSRLCGLAETLKHHWLMGSPDLEFAKLRNLAKPETKPNAESEFEIVTFNFNTKSLVVTHDPKEQNIRKALNFGHTLAHILEGLGEQGIIAPLPHGLAVLVGMKFLIQSKLVAEHGTFADALEELLSAAHLSFPLLLCTGVSHEKAATAFYQLARGDKKNENQDSLAARVQEFVSLTLPKFGQLRSLNEKPLNSSEPEDFSFKITIDKFIQLLKESNIIYI